MHVTWEARSLQGFADQSLEQLAGRYDLLVVSGDFTQRARVAQYRQASAYLNRLRADGFGDQPSISCQPCQAV